MKLVTKSRQETQKVGEEFAQKVVGGEVVCLYGELGSGKTTFTQGLARNLGIKRRILSPTFIIVRHYPISNKPIKDLYHVDLYRINDPKEALELGLTDWLHKPDSLVVIEWPERLGHYLPRKRFDIYFKYLNDNEREIEWIT